jgi:hypothetical protein
MFTPKKYPFILHRFSVVLINLLLPRAIDFYLEHAHLDLQARCDYSAFERCQALGRLAVMSGMENCWTFMSARQNHNSARKIIFVQKNHHTQVNLSPYGKLKKKSWK